MYCSMDEEREREKIIGSSQLPSKFSFCRLGMGQKIIWVVFSDTCLCISKTNNPGGFPGGAVVENLPANAEDTGSSPGLGRSHMLRGKWACEPQLLSLRIWSLCSATRETAIVRGPRTAMRSCPRSPQLEKALAQKRRPNTAINK